MSRVSFSNVPEKMKVDGKTWYHMASRHPSVGVGLDGLANGLEVLQLA